MKKIFALLICAFLIFTLTIIPFAETEPAPPVDTESPQEDTTETASNENTDTVETEPVTGSDTASPPETESPFPDSFPIEEESTSEGEISADTTTPEEPTETVTDKILAFVKEHFGDISVVGSLLMAALYKYIKDKTLHKAIGTLNNNSVTIAENSQTAIQNAANVIAEYKEQINELLTEFRTNADDKKKLEAELAKVEAALTAAKLANVELANELAELLVLSNIPNSKKEELYARHLAAVNSIAEAEKPEVITDDGQDAE